MMRRARINVRPNVKPAGRAPAASSGASLGQNQSSQDLNDSNPSQNADVIVEKVTDVPQKAAEVLTGEEGSRNEQSTNSRFGEDAPSESTKPQDSSSTSGLQRRKRFTALPNLAKPRASQPSTITPESPAKPPVKPLTPIDFDKSISKSESSSPVPEPTRNARIPTKRRISGGSKVIKVSPPPLKASLENQQERQHEEVSAVPLAAQQGNVGTCSSGNILVDKNPPKAPVASPREDMVLHQKSDSGPALGQNELDLLRDRHQKLKHPSKILKSLTSLKDSDDLIKLAQARKLRDLLKKQIMKDKEEKKKAKLGHKERKAPKDNTKMTMRELIYYLPISNPMKSFTEEEQPASETVLDDSSTPDSSKTPVVPPVQETVAEEVAEQEDEEEEEEEATEENQPEEEEPLLVPRVKVAADGSLIIDEESLTVQVSRAKGPNLAEDGDPIFERGSTTTYSSFRKGTYTKPWSNGETDMFFLAISMVGTDFSMIGQLFPHRARLEIKNKFKKEERFNTWRIDKAFKEKRRLDLDFFKRLMDHVLKDEEIKRNKNKALSKFAKPPKSLQWKAKEARGTTIYSSDDSESDLEVGEKENEVLCNDASDFYPKTWAERGGTTPSERKTNRANEEEQLDDCENATSNLLSLDDGLRASDSSENINKSPAIKPAQLKGRPQRQVPNISHSWGDRRPLPNNRILEKGDANISKVPSSSVQEEEESHDAIVVELEDFDELADLKTVQQHIFNKPTRSGRIPKLSKHVIQAVAEEDEENEEEFLEIPPSSKVSGQAVRAPVRKAKIKTGPRLIQGIPRRGKSRLVTLLASGNEDDDDEEEDERVDVEECVLLEDDLLSNAEEENQAFVPMSLRPQPAVSSEVVETMEELDISVNVPDILGTSQNALCQAYECEQAVMPASHVPCEHQLDLLIDVIEFLDPDHMEVCNQINNEAAETLLTIGNSAQIVQTAEITGEFHLSEGKEDDEDTITEKEIRSVAEDIEMVNEDFIIETAILREKEENGNLVDLSGDTATETILLNVKVGVDAVSETTTLCTPSMFCSSEIKNQVESKVPEASLEEPSTLKNKPIKSQTTSPVPVKHGTQELASSSAPPSKRGRFSKPKPNIDQNLRTRRAPQKKLSSVSLADSLKTSKETKLDTEEVQAMQDRKNHSESIMIPPEDTIVNRSTGTPECTTENDGRGSTLRNFDVSVTEENTDPELTNSTSDNPPKPGRRLRGPPPRPNLTLSSRQPNQSQQPSIPAEICTKSTSAGSSEEFAGATIESDVLQQSESRLIVQDASATSVSEYKEIGVTRDDDIVGSNEILKRCEAEEPLFILSLTEIPPSLNEGVRFLAEPLPPTDFSEPDAYGISENESKEVTHLLMTDSVVPIEEKSKAGRSGGTKRQQSMKSMIAVSRCQENAKDLEKMDQLCVAVEENASAEVTGEKEFVETKRKPLERTRRAKLQVKPIPVSRRSTQEKGNKEDTSALDLKQLTISSHTSTQEMRSEPSFSASISTSTNVPDRERADEHIPEESVQENSCQSIMGQTDPFVKETLEITSGSDSQREPLIRPGRRPKGFLSFMSSKSTQAPSAGHKGSRAGIQKPVVNTNRLERKRVADSSLSSAPKRPSSTPIATSELSEEEPTSVSKYFFSDIFTEVEEQEGMD